MSPGSHPSPQAATPSFERIPLPSNAADSSSHDRLYADFGGQHLSPLWTQRDDLMPMSPTPRAAPHVWHWDRLMPLARRAGELVPVGRGGERRAIALANPGLGGMPYATPTLWAAIQYLGPREEAPEHRHSQNAFRFVLEGEGVWTVVDGDPVAMRRGDLVLTPGWKFHGHRNATNEAMVWLDGLDIPFAHHADTGFFEFGPDKVSVADTPALSRSERLWAHPGLRPLSQLGPQPHSPVAAYRWEHTDRALSEQLALEDEGRPATVGPGHAAVRYVNPATGGDVMPTLRAEFHRLRDGARTAERREVGSAVWQVFAGRGRVTLNGAETTVERGDLFVVPSWTALRLEAETGLDLFRFADTPIFERLGLDRVTEEDR